MSWQTPFQELLWNMVNLKITLKKEYSEIQSGRITQGFNFKIVLSFPVFISSVCPSRVFVIVAHHAIPHNESRQLR